MHLNICHTSDSQIIDKYTLKYNYQEKKYELLSETIPMNEEDNCHHTPASYNTETKQNISFIDVQIKQISIY